MENGAWARHLFRVLCAQPAFYMDPLLINEGDPQGYVDWLVKEHICEWCGCTLGFDDVLDRVGYTPKRRWLCRVTKTGNTVTKHRKNWMVCRRCSAGTDFAKWIFPVIANWQPEHESLTALAEVQPMNEPNAQIMYMDMICDDPGPAVVEHSDIVRFRDRFTETALNVIDYHLWQIPKP